MSEPLALETVPPAMFRRTMGAFATGIAVLTTELDGSLHGMTVNSLTSVSLNPVSVLVCLQSGSGTARAVRRRGRFGLNILSSHQSRLSRQFCGPLEARFDGVELSYDESGIPVISGAIAHMRCRVQDVRASGDHEIFVGGVEHCAAADGPPLIFLRGRFGTFSGETDGGEV